MTKLYLFNAEDTESCLSEFLDMHDAQIIVKEKPCFKKRAALICLNAFKIL